MKKRWRLLLVIVAVVGITGAGWGGYLLLPPRPGVALANFRWCYDGMTIKEAEAILGGPATAHRVRQYGSHFVATAEWEGEQGTVTLWTSCPTGLPSPGPNVTGGAFVFKNQEIEWMEGQTFRSRVRRWTGW